MRALLAEGMDAGLVRLLGSAARAGFTQADFDGSPMVTDTMCDEDILNLARVLRDRDEGFIQITQATGHIKDDLAFLERLAAEANRPILHNAIAPARQRSEDSSAQPRVAQAMPRKGPADLRADRDAPHRLRVHARALESLRREPRVARGHNRQQRRKNRQDERSRAACSDQARARRSQSQARSDPGRRRRTDPPSDCAVGRATSRSWKNMSASRSAKSRAKKTSMRST